MNVNTAQNDTGVVKGNFKSCTLVKQVDTSSTEIISQTSLIPEKFAVVGKMIELKDDNGWVSWLVASASTSIVVDPVDPKVLIKAHRRATGDSMPKRSSK